MFIKKIYFVVVVFIGCFLFLSCNPNNENTSNSAEKNQENVENQTPDKEHETKYRDLFIHYKTWKSSIKIEHGKLYHTSTEYEYDNPVSGTPSKAKTHTLIDGKELSPKDLQGLVDKITTSKFMSLEKNTYGADENQRYYPYMLKVKWNNQEKEVHFRSSPQAEKAPEAFNTLADVLTKFAEGK